MRTPSVIKTILRRIGLMKKKDYSIVIPFGHLCMSMCYVDETEVDEILAICEDEIRLDLQQRLNNLPAIPK